MRAFCVCVWCVAERTPIELLSHLVSGVSFSGSEWCGKSGTTVFVVCRRVLAMTWFGRWRGVRADRGCATAECERKRDVSLRADGLPTREGSNAPTKQVGVL